jgi:hypothetical protein
MATKKDLFDQHGGGVLARVLGMMGNLHEGVVNAINNKDPSKESRIQPQQNNNPNASASPNRIQSASQQQPNPPANGSSSSGSSSSSSGEKSGLKIGLPSFASKNKEPKEPKEKSQKKAVIELINKQNPEKVKTYLSCLAGNFLKNGACDKNPQKAGSGAHNAAAGHDSSMTAKTLAEEYFSIMECIVQQARQQPKGNSANSAKGHSNSAKGDHGKGHYNSAKGDHGSNGKEQPAKGGRRNMSAGEADANKEQSNDKKKSEKCDADKNIIKLIKESTSVVKIYISLHKPSNGHPPEKGQQPHGNPPGHGQPRGGSEKPPEPPPGQDKPKGDSHGNESGHQNCSVIKHAECLTNFCDYIDKNSKTGLLGTVKNMFGTKDANKDGTKEDKGKAEAIKFFEANDKAVREYLGCIEKEFHKDKDKDKGKSCKDNLTDTFMHTVKNCLQHPAPTADKKGGSGTPDSKDQKHEADKNKKCDKPKFFNHLKVICDLIIKHGSTPSTGGTAPAASTNPGHPQANNKQCGHNDCLVKFCKFILHSNKNGLSKAIDNMKENHEKKQQAKKKKQATENEQKQKAKQEKSAAKEQQKEAKKKEKDDKKNEKNKPEIEKLKKQIKDLTVLKEYAIAKEQTKKEKSYIKQIEALQKKIKKLSGQQGGQPPIFVNHRSKQYKLRFDERRNPYILVGGKKMSLHHVVKANRKPRRTLSKAPSIQP